MKRLLLIACTLLPLQAIADLTAAQYTALNTDMQTNPEVAALVTAQDDIGLAAYYNGQTAESGWITNFSMRDLFDVVDWQEVIARSAAERGTLQFMFTLGQVDAGQANVRRGLADIFSGAAARTVAQRQALVSAAQRPISRVEKLLSIGSTGGVFQLGFEGSISSRDAAIARTMP